MPMPMMAMGCDMAVDGVAIAVYELQLDTAPQDMTIGYQWKRRIYGCIVKIAQ